MSFYEFSSAEIGNAAGDTYSVAKMAVRKQWALMRRTSTSADVAAYFRSEEQARAFCDTFGLELTDWSDND